MPEQKAFKLSAAQHNLIVQMRNGAKVWRTNISRKYMTDTHLGSKSVHSTVTALQRLGLISYADATLTTLGKNLKID